MKVIPRILKIVEVSEGKVHCVFNTGEYRVIDIKKFISDHKLEDSKRVSRLKDQAVLEQAVVDGGTLSWPNLLHEVSLPGGQTFEVAFDLDPIMLYDSSIEDAEREGRNRIGDLLKAARKAVGLTQEQLADRVGTSKGYISRIENNRSDIELNTLKRIVEVGLDKRLAIVD